MKLMITEKQKIGGCLKRLRELLRLTPEIVAYDCDISVNNVLSWEEGKLSDDSAIYVEYIYLKTRKYSGHTVPMYFKDYYNSKPVQDRLSYYKTIGYAFRYMRKRVLKQSMTVIAKDSGVTENCIRDIEHNVYVGKEKIRSYANYIFKETGARCNYKIVKIANECYLK